MMTTVTMEKSSFVKITGMNQTLRNPSMATLQRKLLISSMMHWIEIFLKVFLTTNIIQDIDTARYEF